MQLFFVVPSLLLFPAESPDQAGRAKCWYICFNRVVEFLGFWVYA